MFLEARSLPWLEATEKIIDIMTSKISTNRRKYLTKPPQGIVTHIAQQMKSEWESAALLVQVSQHEAEDKEQYKVVGFSTSGESDQRKTSHLITPLTFWCTCGLCQDLCYPCLSPLHGRLPKGEGVHIFTTAGVRPHCEVLQVYITSKPMPPKHYPCDY